MSKPLLRSAKAPRKVKTVITGARIAFGQYTIRVKSFPKSTPLTRKVACASTMPANTV